jgi:hypothetical protein
VKEVGRLVGRQRYVVDGGVSEAAIQLHSLSLLAQLCDDYLFLSTMHFL